MVIRSFVYSSFAESFAAEDNGIHFAVYSAGLPTHVTLQLHAVMIHETQIQTRDMAMQLNLALSI